MSLSVLRFHVIVAMPVLLAVGLVFPVNADERIPSEMTFVRDYCNDCHAGGAEEGGLAIDTLGRDLRDANHFAQWERIFDRVKSGEMPPPDADQPDDREREEFAELLAAPLLRAHASTKGTQLRRLNRREYQNTLNDLFGTKLNLERILPEDGRSHEFDNVGSALNISMVQLQRYLDAIDRVMDASIAKTVERPSAKLKNANYADTREGEKHIGSVWKQLDDGAVVFFKPLGYPTGMLRTANIDEAGRYRVKVTGYAYQSDRPVTFAIGATTFQRGLERPTFAYLALPPGPPSSVEIEAWIETRYMIELTPWGITDRNREIKLKGIDAYSGPGLAILDVEIEGPLLDQFPSRGHHLLFDGLQRVEVEPRNPSVKSKPWYVPSFTIETDDPHRDAAKVLRRVATAAFRRPVEESDIDPFLSLFDRELAGGESVEQSLRTATAAIFCSPGFLYLNEQPGRLDDHALASRLSYFLTRTSPDEELRLAAAKGKLAADQESLLAHTRRLLLSPKRERFVTDLTDAWLNLREIEFTAPDKNLYPEFDPFLKFSMLSETRSFIDSLISNNEATGNLVRCDYAMLNNRLAEHYEIEGVIGPEIRRVQLPEESVRGGLLSQASILKVSANGTNTSPVVRGVWVLERMLGITPPPPPPGIPGVEPDIRGSSTLRELLDQHRDSDTCRSCHTMIDPPGFALESFDPIGGWRTRFRSLGGGDRVDMEVNGLRVRYKLGPPVDASGQLADGTGFSGFREFRDLLARDQRAITMTVATKLMTFATGREMGFSDRSELESIVDQCAKRGHGFGDLIELVVTSEIFLHK